MDFYYRSIIHSFNEDNITLQTLEWLDSNIQTDLEDSDSSNSDSQSENKENEKYMIQAFGITQYGNSVCLNIHDFTPFFYIKVPDTWTKYNVTMFISKLSDKLANTKKNINGVWMNLDYSKNLLHSKCILQYKYDFFGFTNKTQFKFLRLTFNNSDAMKKSISIIKEHNKTSNFKKKLSGFGILPLYEANLDNIIRFGHIRNIQFSGWLSANNISFLQPEERYSSCQLEFNVKWTDIHYHNNDSNAPILQASYDIETYSVDGSFPLPHIKGNVITQIATAFKILGQDNFYIKHIICLKNCSPIYPSDDNVPVFLECYNTEKEVLIAWQKLLHNMDPDILYQYNGDQFDGNYIHTRAQLLKCNLFLGKLKNEKSIIKESTFESSAYGSSFYKRLILAGRINYDILTYIKREYKETSYKLDYISEKYLNQNKNPVTPQMLFQYFAEGNPDKIKILAEYCIVDTLLPQRLVDKLCILQNQISMSNITHVPIRYLIERGQQIKVFSQILKETRKLNYVVPTIDNYPIKNNENKSNDDSDDEEDKFTGATVLDPISGAYYEPITVCDFSSLYPSIIRERNLCYSTLVLDDSLYGNLKDVEYNIIEWDDYIKGKTIHHKYKFVKSINGIVPDLLADLTLSRKKYKNLMNNATDPFLKQVYDKCQLAVKVSMNSFYGFFAANMLTCKPIAATVTSVGREMIFKTKTFMEKNYENSVVVYGDTDSVFIKFKTDSTEKYKNAIDNDLDNSIIEKLKEDCIKESIQIGEIAAKNATKSLFNKPVSLEYEKVLCPLLLLTKKRYAGMYYSNNPSKPDKMYNTGLVIKRRDNYSLMRDIYSHTIDTLFKDGPKSIHKVIQYIEDTIYNKIINYSFDDLDSLTITKLLKSSYKNINLPHLVLKNKMFERDPGSAPKSNDRIPYVFINPYANNDQISKNILIYIDKKRNDDFIAKVLNNYLSNDEKLNYLAKYKYTNDCANAFKNALIYNSFKDYTQYTLEKCISINKKLSKKVTKKVDIKDKFKLKQYEKTEDPNYVKKYKIPLDSEEYIKLMQNSLCQVLELFMDNPKKIFDDAIMEYRNIVFGANK